MAPTTRVLATVVVAPGMAPLVSTVDSVPPAVTSHGVPEVAAPRMATMRPAWWLPESLVVGAPWLPL